MTLRSEVLVCRVDITNPFSVVRLPLIAYLARLAFHRYRRRWTKRLFKKPTRALFDFAYHTIRLDGYGEMMFRSLDGVCRLCFNARNLQYGGIYMYPSWQVFEHPTAAMMALLLKDNDVCFDIGANWGCMSLIAATITGYHGPIHAFEPIPSTFADLEETVRQAKLEGRIVCHRFALSDRGGTGKMILPDRVNSGWAKLADDGTIEVTLARLDDLVLPDPTFIKIDAEDHEFSILRGAESMLRRTRPYLMFENWVDMRHPELFLAPLRWLEERGYRLYVPGWIWHTANDQCVLYDNDPPRDGSGPMIALLPIIPEHRALMSAHLSLFAAHRDRLSELAEALGSPKTLSVEEGHSPIAMGP